MFPLKVQPFFTFKCQLSSHSPCSVTQEEAKKNKDKIYNCQQTYTPKNQERLLFFLVLLSRTKSPNPYHRITKVTLHIDFKNSAYRYHLGEFLMGSVSNTITETFLITPNNGNEKLYLN